jgi:DNA replication protein DnaC
MSDRNAVTNPVTNAISNAGQTRPVLISNEISTKRSLTGSLSSAPAAHDAEAELQAEYARERLERFLSRRPVKFAAAGELDPRLMQWAQELFAGRAGNLVIAGGVGTGKSWSAWRIGEELLAHGWRGRYEIVSAYQLKMLATPPVDAESLDRLAKTDLLALDDIGAVRVSDWDADHLYALIDERWASERPTIVITNITSPPPGQTLLQLLLGERVASRLADGVTTVVLSGQDRRRQP